MAKTDSRARRDVSFRQHDDVKVAHLQESRQPLVDANTRVRGIHGAHLQKHGDVGRARTEAACSKAAKPCWR